MEPWPGWWNYEVVLSPHLVERMRDRHFSETDLRAMLDDARAWSPSIVPDRFVIESTQDSTRWEIVVEPDDLERTLTVVTAYPVE